MKRLCLLLLLSLSSSAQAAFVEMDLFEAGDALITRDTQTNLEWLDVTATPGLSYVDITNEVGGWASLGFEIADFDQVCGLFDNLGSENACNGRDLGDFGGGAEEFVRKFTDQAHLLDEGRAGISLKVIFSDGTPEDGLIRQSRIRFARQPDGLSAVVYLDFSAELDFAPSTGSFLVRSVPEPSALVLLTIALVLWRHE